MKNNKRFVFYVSYPNEQTLPITPLKYPRLIHPEKKFNEKVIALRNCSFIDRIVIFFLLYYEKGLPGKKAHPLK